MQTATIKNIFKEFFIFIKKSAWAAIFGIGLMMVIVLTQYVSLPNIARYDVIFISAIVFQTIFLITKIETWKEVKVILLFHLVATVMELFKTSSGIGSWSYPAVYEAYFRLFTVPLFTGFLYSAVGSYISRAIRLFNMKFINYPKQIIVGLIALGIYINFFTHHYVYDFRYILFGLILYFFWNTQIHFIIYKKVRKIHFIIAGFLAAFFIWIAENIASYSNVWLYPDQVEYWKIVSVQKIGSWFLLLIISFLLVSLIYRKRLIKK